MDQGGQRFGDLPSTPPIVVPVPRAPASSGWQPVDAPPPPPARNGNVTVRPVPPVQLGMPQFGAPSPSVPPGASPVGFPQ
jgi:hypothetical protein